MKRFAIILSIFAVLLLAVTGCKHEKTTSVPVTGDYLAAGHTGGFVIAGSKATFYVLNNGEMRKDTTQLEGAIPTVITGFNFSVMLSAADYSAAAYLQTSIPSELFSRNGEHIGIYNPDYGYTQVMTRTGGVEYKWYFEGDQSSSSAAVQTFLQGINNHMLGK